jgi:hypothetical protein
MRPPNLNVVRFDEKPRAQLGSLLLGKGLITEEQLDEALAERRLNGGLLGETLVRLGFVFEDELARVLAEQTDMPFLNLDAIPIDRFAAATLPRELGESLLALPVRFTPEGSLVIAVADPLDEAVLPQLQLALRCPIVLSIATPSSIRAGWRSITRS